MNDCDGGGACYGGSEWAILEASFEMVVAEKTFRGSTQQGHRVGNTDPTTRILPCWISVLS